MKNITCISIALCMFFLTACGGGGSSSRSSISNVKSSPVSVAGPGETDMAEQETSGEQVTQAPGEEETQVTPDKTVFDEPNTKDRGSANLGQSILDAAGQSGNPLFGSVVDSWSLNVPAATGVDTTFNGQRFTLTVNREGGSSATLDTDSDDVYVDGVYIPSENPVTNRPSADGYIYKINGSEITAAGVIVEWSNTDPTDYLAGGYWLHVNNDTPGAELGAFIDGPDYDGLVDLPVAGTAIYNGIAGGLYVSSHGTDTGSAEGTFELGEYNGDLRLVADFGARAISGNVSNIGIFNSYAESPEGVIYPLDNNPSSGYGLSFGSAPISQNGQFTGNNLTVTHSANNIASSGGSWAGRFSKIDDSSGNPRGVAGTHKGDLTTGGGTRAVFAGAHYGTTGRFE